MKREIFVRPGINHGEEFCIEGEIHAIDVEEHQTDSIQQMRFIVLCRLYFILSFVDLIHSKLRFERINVKVDRIS